MLMPSIPADFSIMGLPVRALGLGAAWAVVLACSVPTDKAKDIQVVVRLSDSLQSRGILGQGLRDSVYAFAFRVGATGDTQAVANAGFRWSPSDPSIATVEGKPNGWAIVTGLKPGLVQFTAAPMAYEQASSGSATVRVAGRFAIDSVRPNLVHYGDRVTVYGVGVNQLFAVTLGADLFPDHFSFEGNPDGLSSEQWWVPFPASSGLPFFIGPGVFGFDTVPVAVVDTDLFEPDSAAAAHVVATGPGGPRTIAGLPALYFNPALYFEPVDFKVPRNNLPVDWLSFAISDSTQPISFVVTSTVFNDTSAAYTYFADSVQYNTCPNLYCPGPTSRIIFPGTQWICGPKGFISDGVRLPQVTAAFTHSFSSHPQFIQFYSTPGRYELAVVRGYVSRLPPDRFEENDLWCMDADSTFTQSRDSNPTSPTAKHIVIGRAGAGQNGFWFDSLLTIDNPGDADFIRFRVQPPVALADTFVTIHVKSRPSGVLDPSDVDAYVIRVSDFAFMGGSVSVGSDESMTLNLAAGDYYIAVVDVAAQPTRYSICIVKGFGCAPPGAPAQLALATSVARLPRRDPHRDPTVPPAGLSLPLSNGRISSPHR
jgi:hypothetical protein